MKAETARCPAVDKEPGHEIECQYPGGHPRPSVCRVHGPPTGAGAADPSLPPAGYREVSTPETEFYDLFARSGSAIPRNKWYRCSTKVGSSASCGRIPPPHRPGGGHKASGPAPAPAAVLRPDRVPGRAGPQRREPGAPPVRGGADRSRRDESGSGDGGHSSGRPAGAGPHGSMWSWATPASSGMWPPGWSWRRGDGADAGPDRGQNFAALRDMLAPLPGEPRQRGPAAPLPAVRRAGGAG